MTDSEDFRSPVWDKAPANSRMSGGISETQCNSTLSGLLLSSVLRQLDWASYNCSWALLNWSWSEAIGSPIILSDPNLEASQYFFWCLPFSLKTHAFLFSSWCLPVSLTTHASLFLMLAILNNDSCFPLLLMLASLINNSSFALYHYADSRLSSSHSISCRIY